MENCPSIWQPQMVRGSKRPTGIYERHSKRCLSRTGGKCSCTPTWEAKVWDSDAKQSLSHTFKKKKDAEEWREEMRVALRNRSFTGASGAMTVGEFGDRVMAQLKAGEVKGRGGNPLRAGTVRTYRNQWEHTLRPLIGHRKLNELSRPDIQEMIDRWRAEGKAPATITSYLLPLAFIMRQAIIRGLVAASPVHDIGVGRKAVVPAVAFSTKEIDAHLEALEGWQKIAFLIFADTGARLAEVTGLTWDDVDLERKMIHFDQQWSDVEKKRIDPKTEAGKRAVPMTPRLARALKAYRQSFGDTEVERWLFPSSRLADRPMATSTVRTNILKQWEASDLTPIKPHALRHSMGTDMEAHGVTPRRMADILGHSDPGFTLRRYTHPDPEVMADAIESLGRD